MLNLYKENTANFPRLSTDNFFINYNNYYKFDEITEKTVKYIEDWQLLDENLWETFVDQYREQPDANDGGWRGEYWGKMMRGACFVYSYTRNQKLYNTLTIAVKNILKTQDKWGRISTYEIGKEFAAWDIWSRKYVLLGMQYFLEINKDEALENEIIKSMCRQVDYIISKIGNSDEGKLPITRATKHWYGLNSSSLLEPVVRLYNITGEKKYFDFAQYIVDEGGASVENIFRLAEKKELSLYQYPVTKAYEMTSCFEGLLEFYRVTGEEWYKTAIINFCDLILEDDFTVIGSSGCTHELFDHSTVRQASTNNHPIMQETCVTVTLMKFFLQLNLLTGEAKYIDAFETAYYNAYLGSINTEKKTTIPRDAVPEGMTLDPLPFDSYSPLTKGIRGHGIGGFRVMTGNKFYGCCVCIGSAGIGSVHKASLLTYEKGLVLNLFIKGEYTSASPSGKPVSIKIDTLYPVGNTVRITVNCEENFILKIRNPQFSKETKIVVGENLAIMNSGYNDVHCKKGENDISLTFDMPTQIIKPVAYETQELMNKVIWGENSRTVATIDKQDPQALLNVALKRGPLMLAQDSRFGYDLSVPAEIIDNNGLAEITETENEFNCMLTVNAKTKKGQIKLCDYASCGKLYGENENFAAVWIKNK
ncbi:MAG: glycoside hydrolase family 127 protein [Acutalibacteraceae bacterium]|nr:glycoside hydrolase family 127 protein [Acutalibacteraceae bacterium]